MFLMAYTCYLCTQVYAEGNTRARCNTFNDCGIKKGKEGR